MSSAVEVDIRNPTGLHARPAAVFVKAAAGFRAAVRVANVTTGSVPVNAKSILAVLSLGASSGHRIRLCAEGDDEAEAVLALADLVGAGLGEAASPDAAGVEAVAGDSQS